MLNILITGGGGYVGSSLVPYLLSKDFNITVIDLFLYGEEVLPNHKNLKKINLDIRDQESFKDIVKNHDIVIHLACISNDPSFELNPSLGKSINLDCFEPMIKNSKKSGVKKFIYASSSSVYGIKEEKDVNENMTLEPLTDYSKFKAECEKILSKYSSQDFITTTLRPATVCGYSPRQRLDVVVNIFTNLAVNKKEINVFGGNQLRPNINIKDMVRAYLFIINANPDIINDKIFNVGFDNHTVYDLAAMTKKIVGDDIKLNIVPTDDNRSYHISSKKIFNELGFKTEFDIEDAIFELKNAMIDGRLKNTLEDPKYFNIKTMQNINLK